MAKGFGSGALSTSIAAWVRQFSTLILYVIGARLLPPEDLGAFALASSFLLVMEYAVHDSISELIVQRRGLEPGHRRAALILGLAAAVLVVLFGLTFADPLARLFRTDALSSILPIMSLAVALICATSLQMGLIRRAAHLHYLAGIVSGSALVSTALAIVLLANGHGLDALIWYFVLEKVLLATGNLVGAGRTGGGATSRQHFRDLGPFIMAIAGQRSVSYSRSQLDRIVIGILWGPEILGAYQLAAKVYESIVAALLIPATKVFFILFSRLQADLRAVTETFVSALTCVAVVSVPSFLGLALVADQAVPVLFGENWGATAQLLQMMALAGLPMTFSLMSGALLTGLGRAKTFLAVEMLTAAVGAAVILAVSTFGIVWIAFAILMREVIAMTVHVVVVRRYISLSDVRFTVPAICVGLSLIMCAGLFLIEPSLQARFDPAAALMISVVAGAAFYAAVMLLAFQGLMKAHIATLARASYS